LCESLQHFLGAHVSEQTPQVFEQPSSGRVLRTRYLLSLPEGYQRRDSRWPLLLFLHGAGERGDDPEQLKAHGPPRLLAEGHALPFIVVSPQCPRGRYWLVPVLTGLLDELCSRYRVDEARIYVTGISMGGYGTWHFAAAQPERLAAIIPICGGGDPSAACDMKDLPVWAFHGARDPLVPLEESEVMVQAVRNCGGTVHFTIYPEAGHDCWTDTYAKPDWYEWLLKHRRAVHAR
jgi:predicted peptidase